MTLVNYESINKPTLLAINDSSIGLAMTSALSLASWLQQALRLSSDVESLLVPVGKIFEISKIESEPNTLCIEGTIYATIIL